jgi:hypothetical protein
MALARSLKELLRIQHRSPSGLSIRVGRLTAGGVVIVMKAWAPSHAGCLTSFASAMSPITDPMNINFPISTSTLKSSKASGTTPGEVKPVSFSNG